MMDESLGKENLIHIIKEFNKKTPFMVLNDLRLAHATNSLRRIEVLKSLITSSNDTWCFKIIKMFLILNLKF